MKEEYNSASGNKLMYTLVYVELAHYKNNFKQIEMWTCDWYNFIVLDEVAKNLAP